MNLHPNTTLTTAVLVIVTALLNVAMAYFNITGNVSCKLTAMAPDLQAAAAASIGK